MTTYVGPCDLDVPTPDDLFSWFPLVATAAVRERWRVLSSAIDDAHVECIADERDWPKCVLGTAADLFAEFSLEYEALRHWSARIWWQMEAQQ